MGDIFLKLFNHSMQAGWIILAVIPIRFLFQKIPKRYCILMWAIVAVKLLVPISVETSFSLVPQNQIFTMESQDSENINQIIPNTNNEQQMFEPVQSKTNQNETIENNTNKISISTIASVIWLVGVVIILIFSMIEYWKLKRRTAACLHKGEQVKVCDDIDSPFLFGLFHPFIYMPSNMPKEYEEYVFLHENVHLKRHDNWWKIVGFILITIYWFHPLVWLAYFLFCRDLEFSCDEMVIKNLSFDRRKEYSNALLSISIGKKQTGFYLLSFGRVEVKKRIENILNYKKPKFWIGLISLIVIAFIVICFMTNPIKSSNEESSIEVSDELERAITESVLENEDSFEHKSLKEVKSYLKTFSSDSESLEKEGCFVSVHGVNGSDAVNIWNTFIQKVNEQKAAQIVFAQFTDEGDAVLDYLEYNGSDFYHVCDSTRDEFFGTGERYYEETFPYLKLFEKTNDNGDNQKYLVLTTQKDLSYDMFYKAYYEESKEVSLAFEYRLLLTYVTGNANINLSEQEGEHDVSYNYDMSKILLPLDKIIQIEITNGNTGETKMFSALDSSNGFKDIMALYEKLDVTPDEELAYRYGYGYKMLLYGDNEEFLQDVTPYKDCVCIDGTMYDGQLNATTTQLLLKLDSLEW